MIKKNHSWFNNLSIIDTVQSVLEDYGKTVKQLNVQVNGQLGWTNFSLRTINVCSKATLQTGQHTSKTTCLSSRLVVQQVAKVMGLVTVLGTGLWRPVPYGTKKKTAMQNTGQPVMNTDEQTPCAPVLHSYITTRAEITPLCLHWLVGNFVSCLMFCRRRADEKLSKTFTLHDYFGSLRQC